MVWMFGKCVTLENEFTFSSLHHRLVMRWRAILEAKVMTMQAVPQILTRSFETSRSRTKSAMLLWVLLWNPSSVLPLPLSQRNITIPSRWRERWLLLIAGSPPHHLPDPCPVVQLPATHYSTTLTPWPAAVVAVISSPPRTWYPLRLSPRKLSCLTLQDCLLPLTLLHRPHPSPSTWMPMCHMLPIITQRPLQQLHLATRDLRRFITTP